MKQVVTSFKTVATITLGWILVFVGFAGLVLPGPGLVALAAGLVLLSTQYEWAERRLEPVKKQALKTAQESVASKLNIFSSFLGTFILMASGIAWGLQPAVPGWWPFNADWWLPGGWVTGGTMIGSAIFAQGTIVYSYFKFRK